MALAVRGARAWVPGASPSEIASKRPRMAKAVRRLLPPWLMKGRVMPVRGMKLVTPPMLRRVWVISTVVSPLASKSPKGVRLP